jgi:hypothetical protein
VLPINRINHERLPFLTFDTLTTLTSSALIDFVILLMLLLDVAECFVDTQYTTTFIASSSFLLGELYQI